MDEAAANLLDRILGFGNTFTRPQNRNANWLAAKNYPTRKYGLHYQ